MAYEAAKYQIVPWRQNPKKWAYVRLDLGHCVGPYDTQKLATRAARRALGLSK